MPGGTKCACGRRRRDCRICGACKHGVLHRLCTEGCAAKADVQMACNWVSNVVLEAPVQPSAAGAAAAGCTAAADRGDAAVALLELAGIGKEAGALDTPARRIGQEAWALEPRTQQAAPAVAVVSRWAPAHGPSFGPPSSHPDTHGVAGPSQVHNVAAVATCTTVVGAALTDQAHTSAAR